MTYKELEEWYADAIEQSANVHGGRVSLSKKLGHDKSFLTKVLTKGTMIAKKKAYDRLKKEGYL